MVLSEMMVTIAPAQFPGSMALVDASLDALLRSTLQPVEQLLMRVTTAPGEGLAVTNARVIVLKDAAHNETGRSVGRFFPLDGVTAIDVRRGLFGAYMVFVTGDTAREPTPFDKSRCSFIATFRDRQLLRNVEAFLRSVMSAVLAARSARIATGQIQAVAAPLGVIAERGERFYYECPAALFAEHVYKEYVGRTQGMSFRVMPGMYYRVGGIRGRSVSRSVTELDDRGVVGLSNRRMVFVGSARTHEIRYAVVAGVSAFADGFQVNLKNKAPIRVQTGEGLGGLYLQRLMSNPP